VSIVFITLFCSVTTRGWSFTHTSSLSCHPRLLLSAVLPATPHQIILRPRPILLHYPHRMIPGPASTRSYGLASGLAYLPCQAVGGISPHLFNSMHHLSSPPPGRQPSIHYLPDTPDRVARDPLAQSEECTVRYGPGYLEAFSKSATQYCNSDSASDLTCFSHNAIDDRTDSFCIGSPGLLQPDQNSVALDCTLRDWTEEALNANVPQLQYFTTHWYNTGPHAIFAEHIQLDGHPHFDAHDTKEAKGFSLLVQRELAKSMACDDADHVSDRDTGHSSHVYGP
jgi:hypothetical protein